MVTTICTRCRNAIDVTGLDPGDGITCPYCSNEFLITRQFGNFLLEKQLGQGGMGAVYLGCDVTLNRVVAVKVLRPELVSDQKFMATFLREAEITASLNHPNIVQVYAFGQHEGVYYMVVEYIAGGSLDDKISKLGRITELEGIEIGIAVARGLECALERGGLIHRDIKPGNILFNSSNTPKVVDFGLSLSMETTDHFDGEIWGTPYYVAPEKLEREQETFCSDLYSLGATLFHAISGRPPYEGEDPNDVAMKHLSGNVISLKAFVPDISDQTAYAVSKAMARYPEDRYESYAAFIQQLEDAKRRITDPNFKKNKKQDVSIIGDASESKTTLWLILGLLAIVVILVGVFIWKGTSLFKDSTNSSPTELSDYTPKATQPAAPKPVIAPPPAPITPPEATHTEPPPAVVPPPPPPKAEVVTPKPQPQPVVKHDVPKPTTTNSSGNLALNMPTVASSNQPALGPEAAVDGDLNTHWASIRDDNQWLYVDLGQVRTIDHVVLNWLHYASDYKIQVSNDAQNWTDAAEIKENQDGIVTIPISTQARYVRMLGIKRGEEFGYCINELEVYATPGTATTTASATSPQTTGTPSAPVTSTPTVQPTVSSTSNIALHKPAVAST